MCFHFFFNISILLGIFIIYMNFIYMTKRLRFNKLNSAISSAGYPSILMYILKKKITSFMYSDFIRKYFWKKLSRHNEEKNKCKTFYNISSKNIIKELPFSFYFKNESFLQSKIDIICWNLIWEFCIYFVVVKLLIFWNELVLKETRIWN